MRSRFFAIIAVMLVVVVAAGMVYAQRGGTDPNNPNRVILKHRLDPPSKVTQGQLQVVGKDGAPMGRCPLQHTTVTAQVSGFVARVDVVQEFANPLDEKIEAVYVFPLPSDCAVDQMEMTVGDRVVRGEIKRREEARQIYETAKATGHVASLLDQERPNIFTQSVANIMPGAKVKIKISYVDVLRYEDGQYEFVFPMVVGPRYIPGGATGQTGTGRLPDTDKVPDASKITPPITPEGTRAGHDISVSVNINAGVTLGEVKSVLHEVNVARESSTDAKVILKDLATIPNKDFILRYKVAGDEVKTGFLPNTRSAGDGYFSFMLVPPKTPTAAQIMPKEMIFVIDTSGSQQGWPVEKAKETMKLCIEKMNPGDTFNLLAFSNGVTPLFAKPQPNSVENRAFAQEFLTSRLGTGGTEMMKAIDAALLPPGDPKRLRIVCFMTDGYVGNDFEILDAVKKNIGNARMYPFGIGNSTNRFLLDGMAKLGRGQVEYVTLQEEGKGFAEKFYDRISKPVLTDINVDWGDLPIYDVYPNKVPDLFANKPVVIQGRYDKPMKGTIIVSGLLGGRPWSEKIAVTLPGHEEENTALPSLWARSRISDLMDQDYMGIQKGTPDPKLKEDIIQVALAYQLMSQYTSFVAVEEKIVTENGKPKTVAVPVEMPEGVSYQGVLGGEKEEMAAKSLGLGYSSRSLSAASGFGGPQGPAAPMTVAPAAPGAVAASKPANTARPNWSSAAGLKGAFGGAVTEVVKDKADFTFSTDGKVAARKKQTDNTFSNRRDARNTAPGDAYDEFRQKSLQQKAAREQAVAAKTAKLQSCLDPVLRSLPAKLKASATGSFSLPGKVVVTNGAVRVSIKLTDYSDANLAKLRALGIKPTASSQSLAMVIAVVPVAKLESLALLDCVVRVAPVM